MTLQQVMPVLTDIFTVTPSDDVMGHVDKPFFMCCRRTTMFAFAFKLMSEINGNKMCQKVVFK